MPNVVVNWHLVRVTVLISKKMLIYARKCIG